MDSTLIIKLNLRLTHFPYALDQVNPATLLTNSTMRNHGQLISIKLARVVNTFPPQFFLHSKLYVRSCRCLGSPEKIVEVNQNPLKIFKNQVNFSSRMGKHLYYDTIDQENERTCDECKTRYLVKNQRYAPCQKAEILSLTRQSGKRQLINLQTNISTLWLIEPFVNQLEIGDVINLTAYYYMNPQ